MKKTIKIKLLFVAILLLVLVPINTYAITKETYYTNINSIQNIEVSNLIFSDISFKTNSNVDRQEFGIVGKTINNTSNEIEYSQTIYYYDSSYNEIAHNNITRTAPLGTNDFYQMQDEIILGTKQIKDIFYFRIVTDIKEQQEEEEETDELYPYIINNYDINIKVNENNIFDITENLEIYFNQPRHGIIRKIPLTNEIIRVDGTHEKNRTQITKVNVNDKFKGYRKDDNYNLQIGSSNRLLTKNHIYKIKYKYNLGKDPLKNCDELYYNIIGDKWDTIIKNTTFTIEMPKEFDNSKLGFSVGKKGSTTNKISYKVEGNKIIGSYNETLNENEAITVRCELPEGYFKGARLHIEISRYIYFLIPIILLLLALIRWFKYGKDDEVIDTIEFYPPEEYNSLEIGFLYKGYANNNDVVSLLVYLANKGYIEISEMEEKNKLNKKDFVIKKLKEYDGNNINEKIFLDGLFKRKKSLFKEEKDGITYEDLEDKFYLTINKIKSNIDTKENIESIIEKGKKGTTLLTILAILLIFPLITIKPMIEYGNKELLLVALIFPTIGFSLPTAMILAPSNTSNAKKIDKLFIGIWGFLFGGLPWCFTVLPALIHDPLYLIGNIVGILCVFGIIACSMYMQKRTPYGNKILGRIKGFKKFLETAEKEKLESMVLKNPNYFYDILPYSYVLGVSDKWINKFESIAIEPPKWCNSTNSFNTVTFSNFMNTTVKSVENAMVTNYSSSGSSSGGSFSGGGSSSGGGCSGGGSGGGGGSSW